MLKRILVAALSALAVAAPANSQTQAEALATAIVRDFSRGDPKVLETAQAALAGRLPADNMFAGSM